MASSGASGSLTPTYNLMLGIFLKLLGLFAVLYTFTEPNALKVKQAEQSINQRFNIAISLAPEVKVDGNGNPDTSMVRTMGRSYTAISEALKTQVDFLSTEYLATTNILVLRLPADIVLPLSGNTAKSPDFAKILTDTLLTQNNPGENYKLEIIAQGKNETELMREVSVFVQKMIAQNYPQSLLTIGYQPSVSDATVEFRLQQVQP